jgi:hypothetical protein
LKDVKDFSWYVVTSEHPSLQSSGRCRIDTSPIIRNIYAMSQMIESPRMTFHEGGGASEVFLFRMYFDTVFVEGGLSGRGTCVLISSAELSYFDKFTGAPANKLTLWEARNLIDIADSAPSYASPTAGSETLSEKAAMQATILLGELLRQIRSAQ